MLLHCCCLAYVPPHQPGPDRFQARGVKREREERRPRKLNQCMTKALSTAIVAGLFGRVQRSGVRAGSGADDEGRLREGQGHVGRRDEQVHDAEVARSLR